MLARSIHLMLTLALLWLAPWTARAQSLESALAPGRLIQGHVKWEDDCKACHVRFDRAAQDRLCADCHKDVGADLRTRTGLHGRIKPGACRSCHTEHKGRDANIAPLDTKTFDHRLSDYQLRGKHTTTDCAKCHLPGRKYREAASECNACHRGDDKHKGALGPKCADCHTEQNWKDAKFDHDKTRFALTGKHAGASCADCHRNKADGTADYKDTPRTCIGCHKKDDESAKGHKGLYGERCDSCHNARAWKPSTFRHEVDTRYTLRGKHASVKCADCHSGHLYKVKLQQECVSCHRGDDKHKGTLGEKCESCHTERDWKEKARFDHDRTDFPLLGKHAELRCDACHKSTMFKEAPRTCIGCHKADDKHAGTLGDKCESCHNERDWKTTRGRFDHDRTQFKLRNAHATPKVACKACHPDLKRFRKTPTDCDSCHKKDDRHEGQLGRDCASCHDDKSWRVASFNHARTRFVLLGRHAAAACKDCHTTPRYQDAPRSCIGCHDKDDKHKRAFGEACDSCHNTRAWSLWAFDHNQRSSYKLDGAHRQVPCEACHTRPAPKGKAFAPLGSNCLACHRKDDVHDGSFGMACEQCHGTSAWKTLVQRGLRTGAASTAPDVLLAAVFGEASHFTQGRP